MKDKLYYDRFAERFVAEKSEYAAPERYTTFYRGAEYIERWATTDGRRLSIMLTKLDRLHGLWEQVRKKEARKAGAILAYLESCSIPSDEFDKIVEELKNSHEDKD